MYIIFAGDIYYPKGGANDIIGYYQTFELALYKFNEYANNNEYEWIHILDTDIHDIVRQYKSNN